MWKARCVTGMALMTACLLVHAGEAAQVSEETGCETLEIGISISIPPWVIKDQDRGIELDLLRKAFANTPYCIEPRYLSFALAYSLFDQGELDGLINAKKGVTQRGYLSEPVVTFQNVAVSLKSKGYPQALDIGFLEDKQVVAFQKADQLLGEDFSEMAASNEGYKEVANQRLQLNLLFIRGVDFIVLDRSIFGYYWAASFKDSSLLSYHNLFRQRVTIHPLFEPSPYLFLFNNKQVRDVFNLGLRKLKDSGEYEQVLNEYSGLVDLYQHDNN